MILLILLGLSISMLLFASGAELPAPVSRSLSIIFPSHASRAESYIHEYGLSDEVGWSSSFRKVLMEMASRNIRQHPWWGKGFRFSINDYWVRYDKRNTMEGIYQELVSTGAYHNSLVELAVAYGLPVVCMFCVVYFGVLLPFLKQLKLSDIADVRILFAGILGLFVAETGQLLMNGGSQDFYIISLLLGVMHYSEPILGIPLNESNSNVMEKE